MCGHLRRPRAFDGVDISAWSEYYTINVCYECKWFGTCCCCHYVAVREHAIQLTVCGPDHIMPCMVTSATR